MGTPSSQAMRGMMFSFAKWWKEELQCMKNRPPQLPACKPLGSQPAPKNL